MTTRHCCTCQHPDIVVGGATTPEGRTRLFGQFVSQGTASKHGYKVRAPDEVRHKALLAAVEEEQMPNANKKGRDQPRSEWDACISVSRHMQARANLTHRTQPENSAVYRQDYLWLRKTKCPTGEKRPSTRPRIEPRESTPAREPTPPSRTTTRTSPRLSQRIRQEPADVRPLASTAAPPSRRLYRPAAH